MQWSSTPDQLNHIMHADPLYEVVVWPLACGDRFIPMRRHRGSNSRHSRATLPPGRFMPPRPLGAAELTLDDAKRICEQHYRQVVERAARQAEANAGRPDDRRRYDG